MNHKPTIYILGAFGFLGSRCVEYFQSRGYEVFTNRIDVSDLGQLKDVFGSLRPDVAINLTGPPANPTIDWCEDHREETVKMIVSGPINFTLASLECGVYPIQITSGCVYSGGPGYAFTEEDEPNFFGSFYSRMRVASQRSLAELPVLQSRIRMPLSVFSHPRNFINKITSYKRVISIPNSVTLIEDLWPAIEKLIFLRPIGILNLTNEGYIEHKQILRAYKKIVDTDHNYELITLKQLEGPGGITKAQRSNCVLSVKKAKSLGISMPAITSKRLEGIMKKYSQNFSRSTCVE